MKKKLSISRVQIHFLNELSAIISIQHVNIEFSISSSKVKDLRVTVFYTLPGKKPNNFTESIRNYSDSIDYRNLLDICKLHCKILLEDFLNTEKFSIPID